MMQVGVNGKKVFAAEVLNSEIYIEGECLNWDVKKVSQNHYHIIKDDKCYVVEIVKADVSAKTFHLKVNGLDQDIVIKDDLDILLEKMGMTDLTQIKISDLKAPMPGLILDIKVVEGQEVKKGDAIMVLEAMKMENVLKAAGDGVVKAIKVHKGDSVEKNQLLIQF